MNDARDAAEAAAGPGSEGPAGGDTGRGAADAGDGQRAAEAGAGADGDGADGGAVVGDGADEGVAGARPGAEGSGEGADAGDGGGVASERRARAVPVESGTALTGKAAELLAAVRAVERGEREAATFFPAPARPPAPRPVRTPEPVPGARAAAGQGEPVPGPAPAPSAETVAAVGRVLAAGGAPEGLAPRVAGRLGEGAAEALREDPWQLLAVPGVRPAQADEFARGLLESPEPGDGRRVEALVGWLLEQAALRGHTALEFPTLAEALAGYGVPEPGEALRDAAATGGVLVFEEREEPPAAAHAPEGREDGEEEPAVRLLLGLERYAMAEEGLADGLARLVNTFTPPAGPADRAADGGAGVPESSTETPTGAAPGTGSGSYGTPPGDPAAGSYGAGDPEVAVRGDEEGAWEAVAGGAASPSAAELIRAVAGSGVVLHSGGEAARAEPAALVAAARALGLRAYAATHTDDGRDRLAALIDATKPAAGGPGSPSGRQAGAPGTDPGTGPGTATPRAAGDDAPASGTDTAAPSAAAGHAPAPSPAPAAVTVRGLLSGREGPGRDVDGMLAVDLLAVLDAPQLDVEAAAALVEALPDGARLVLSGDPGLLESAGPGRVFADVAAARVCPRVTSRTPDPGPIGELVSGVGAGELQAVEAPGKEVVIVPVQDPGEAVHRTVQLVADSVPRALGVPAADTQVIAVGHGGAAGTRVLNAALKERLNPGPGTFGGFDAGDRVVYVPSPGTAVPGLVTSGDDAGLHLDCGGTAVVVPPDRVGEAVRHGWALTAHQAAGRRWPAAVVVVPGDAESALSRAWAYTAFSRGERHLSVVHGAGPVLARRLAEVPAPPRTTRLRGLLGAQARG